MSPYRIAFNRERGVWSVYATGEFARYVRSFDSLHAAEEWVQHGDAATCPDFVAEA